MDMYWVAIVFALAAIGVASVLLALLPIGRNDDERW